MMVGDLGRDPAPVSGGYICLAFQGSLLHHKLSILSEPPLVRYLVYCIQKYQFVYNEYIITWYMLFTIVREICIKLTNAIHICFTAHSDCY